MNKAATQDLSALEPRDGLYRVPVEGVEGLYLQITPAGAKSWVFRYRMLQGFRKQGSITIGRYPKMSLKEVKLHVKKLAGEVVNHVDPVEAKAERVAKVKAKVAAAPAPVPVSKVPTLRQVAEDFYKGHIMASNQPSTQAIQRYTFDAKVFPEMGDLPIDQVDRRVISKFLDSLSSGPAQRNRIQSLLHKLFTWAGRRVEVLDGKPNPVAGYEHAKTVPREVRLTEDEIRAVGKTFRDESKWRSMATYHHRGAVLFLLLTGCRAGVIYGLKKDHQFPDEGLLRFAAREPGLKGCRAVYMGSAALQLLPKIPFGIKRDQLQRSWEVMRPEGCSATLHDLRRTFASVAADLGHDEGVIDALLGHSRGKIRDAYIHRADTTLMAVAEEVSQHLAQLLGIAK